jgi:hypothetical protein
VGSRVVALVEHVDGRIDTEVRLVTTSDRESWSAIGFMAAGWKQWAWLRFDLYADEE